MRHLLLLPAVLLAACSDKPAGGGNPNPRPDAGTPPVQDSPGGPRFDVGQVVLNELYVSPTGNDGASGFTPGEALRTLGGAWAKIDPAASSAGWRINLARGTYPCEPAEPDDCRNDLADKAGTAAKPIIVRAADGPGSVTLRGGLNLRAVAYLYLMDLQLLGGGALPTNSSGNNLLHLDGGDHVLLRNLVVRGPDCVRDDCNNLQEVLKVNQTQHLYVEDSIFSGAWHSAVDFFAVQHGHFVANHLSGAGQWCMYVKGGTADLRIEGNDLSRCQLGLSAGQSSNLAVMVPPYLQYEAYGLRVVNNVIHDVAGPGFAAQGAYGVLFAYNTLVRVGTSGDTDYGMLQLSLGERGCTATDELPDPVPRCRSLLDAGAFGPTELTDPTPVVPNRRVWIYDNLFYNPAPARTLSFHLAVDGPGSPAASFRNLPAAPRPDDGLVFAGNVLWNAPTQNLPLYASSNGSPAGCGDGHPTCSAGAFATGNVLGGAEPRLTAPAGGDFHPAAEGSLGAVAVPIPDLDWSDAPAGVPPPAALGNAITRDAEGRARAAGGPPGAYAGP